jgi:NDP-sugar pyrophosphorylase family protein
VSRADPSAPSSGTRAFLLAAGRGLRFRPVSVSIPKPLFPFLNVPLARAHLARLRRFGVLEAGVNLHHLGHQIEQDLIDHAAELPKLRFFPEPEILGTAGGLRNAAGFLGSEDFFVVNSDAAIEPDFGELLRRHRASDRSATLLVVANHEPDRYTPLQSEGDRITGFGGKHGGDFERSPLLYTGVCVLAPRLLADIPPGEASLVADVWERLLERGEEIGWVEHEGAFADLGRPRDFLRASLEALSRGGPFPPGAGAFDQRSRVLSSRSREPIDASESALRCVIGQATLGAGARLEDTVVWSGATVGAGASLERCLVAGGLVEPGARFQDSLLWAAPGATAVATPI